MEQVANCPVCESPDIRASFFAEDHTVSHESFTIQRCVACGFQFTSPRPRQDEIATYYQSENYISHVEKAHGFKDRIYHAVRNRAIRSKYKLIAQYQPQGRALDVGCGTGDFLAYLHARGYAAKGVEVSPAARNIAAAKGVAVHASLDDLPRTSAFEVITLWHVLEHVADPRLTLDQLHDLLMPGGLLVVAVPDNESWDCRYYGERWAAWDVPRHLSHFRRKDLRRLIASARLELASIRKMWFDAPYVAMLSEQYRGNGPILSFLKGACLGTWSNMISLVGGRPTSSSLFVIRKPTTAGKASNS
jgi:2-polyprenyl-3-methyl-5-hydroxy-6-metoxy-1,4-benzoquinol methylase